MKTELTTQEYITNAVQSYVPVVVGENQTTIDEHVRGIALYCKSITIAGLNDKKGYDLATAALRKVKKIRTAVEGKRKELKQVALDYGKAVDGEAKRITALVQPIEDELAGKLKAIDDAAELARKAEQTRRHTLMLESGFGCYQGMYTAGIYNYSTEQVMAADEETLAGIVAKGVEERDRAKAEAERLKREREELEAERKRLDAERERLAAETRQREIQAEQNTVQPVVTPKEITVNFTPAEQLSQAGIDLAAQRIQEAHDQPDGVAIAQKPQVKTYTEASEERISLAYEQGFDKAKELMLARLNDPTPITRADLKIFVSSLTFKRAK